MDSRRGFLKTLAAVPAALALVDVRRILPDAPDAAQVHATKTVDGKEYLYVRASVPVRQHDLVEWSPDGTVVPVTLRPHGRGHAAGFAAGAIDAYHYGWIQVRGPVTLPFAAST